MRKKQITSYEQAVACIMNTPKFSARNSMEDTRAFLHVLGDPDRELSILHVAGTNGKGSVCAYLRSVLEAAGRRTAVFTSPHLVDVRERFVVDGKMITREAFLKAFLQVYDALDWKALEEGDGYYPIFSEYLFFMAMLIFAEEKPDYCILETGMGGRLDATNAVYRKEIAVITHISLDHVEYLGHTLGAIAGEKAGIIQSGIPVVYADTCQEVGQVIRDKAHDLSADAYSLSKTDYSFSKNSDKNIDFSYVSRYYGNVSISIPTIAGYQMENCSLALRALEVLAEREERSTAEGRIGKPLQLTREILKQGAASCFWPGRMEEVLPEVYVDGAHNEDGIRAFLESVAADGHRGGRHLLFGVMQDKNYADMLQRIVESGLFDRLSITHIKSGRAAALDALERVLAAYPAVPVTEYESVSEALDALLAEREPDMRIYIAGSLYLVGEVKAGLQAGGVHGGSI